MASTDALDTPLPVGTLIAGQRIEKVIGRGGFGRTYVVSDTVTGEPWALKEYFPRLYAERPPSGLNIRAKLREENKFNTGYQSFFAEAKLLRDLPTHKNVVRVKGLFKKFGTVYMLMEFIDGVPLSAYRTAGKPLGENELSLTLRRIASGLTHLHDNNLMHRDLKPDNVMINKRGQPILIDFGAARQIRHGKFLTSVLSPPYAPLEQRVEAQSLGLSEGPWTDLYALGVLAHEFSTKGFARPPNAMDRYKEVAAGRADPYRPLVADNSHPYSHNYRKACDWALSLYPDARPAVAAELIDVMTGKGGVKEHSVHQSWKEPPKPRQVNLFVVKHEARDAPKGHRATDPFSEDKSSFDELFTHGPADAESAARQSGILPNWWVVGALVILLTLVAAAAVLFTVS